MERTLSSDTVQKNKQLVWEFWQALNNTTLDDVADIVQSYVHEEISWHGAHPINDLDGVDALVTGFWRPLLRAIPDLQRTTEIFIGGHRHWVGAVGYFSGTFTNEWLGIPATGGEIQIRFGEFSAVYDGKIGLTYIIPDVLDVMRQAGYQVVAPSLGREGMATGPMTGDGVLTTPHDDQEGDTEGDTEDDTEGAKTLALAKTMCAELNTPRCEQYWDADGMMWYGPSGIGTTRGYKEFEDFHQTPFYEVFPDYGCQYAGLHVAEVGEGNYAGWVGWPSIRAYHTTEYLGVPPTGKVVEWRLMDFYRREGDLIIENWVPVDMGHLFKTMGVDVFEELKKQL